MELSEIRGGHFCHMGYGSEINMTVVIDDFGDAICVSNFPTWLYIHRIAFIFEGRND